MKLTIMSYSDGYDAGGWRECVSGTKEDVLNWLTEKKKWYSDQLDQEVVLKELTGDRVWDFEQRYYCLTLTLEEFKKELGLEDTL